MKNIAQEWDIRLHQNNLRTAWKVCGPAEKFGIIEAARQVWGQDWWDEIHAPVEEWGT